MNGELELSIIIPAFLEEENLRVLLPRIARAANALSCSHEILVVDTVQPLDSSREVCEHNNASYIHREGGNDYANAVTTGIARARGRFILFMDADGSHPPELIPELFKHRAQCDVVIASRYVEGGFTENNALLVFMSRALNITYRLVLGLKCKDVSNSYKLYRAGPLKQVKLYCRNFDVIEEILFKLNRDFHVRIKEVPATFKKRMFGETKRNLLAFMLGYLFTLIRLRFGK